MEGKDQEQACRDRWDAVFQVNPEKREKYYLNVAFPYPSGAMHVGHGRTYTVPDVLARFWRMRGKQVLFPMGFHVTGTPVIGISKRIAKRDEKTIRLYRDLYRVSQEELDQFTDPMVIVRHFSQEYERVMKRLGLSIDWRRKFITVDPHYSRFIEWQYKHLGEKGYVVKGEHPVKYCPQCENPVGDHDLLEGDKAEIIRFTLVMFQWRGARIPCATLRPETIYGVTNLWVNPRVTYIRVKIDGVPTIVSREAALKIQIQEHEVEFLEELPPGTLVGERVSHPLCGEVPVLPADFVDPDMGSGIVMSVPAHAPFDYIALRDLQRQGAYREITPISLIRVEGFGEYPAKDAVEKAGVENQLDPRMESITQEVYNAEFTRGKMREKFGGRPVRVARDDVAALMGEQYGSIFLYEFDLRPVICRCGGNAYVRILRDQWFLQYSDPAWKERVYQQLARMDLVPPEVRAEFDRTVGWLKDWACTRRVGLGTRLPWDRAWIIEPLSDSTIYMAYYTIAHRIRQLDPAILSPEVFDYIFLGRESPDLPERAHLDGMREEFLYWYPYNHRFSAKDLISNHLTFQLFHHQAIFLPELQPRGLVVFGMGLLNGAKMSSSKGNVVLLEDAIDEFGADTVRMFLVGSAEPWQDFDWRNELVYATRKQIDRFSTTALEGDQGSSAERSFLGPWLLSRLQARIEGVTRAMELFQTRQGLQEAYHGIESDLRWYRRRLGDAPSGSEMKILARAWIRLLAPYTPYICEQLWQQIGEEGLVSVAPWPEKNSDLVDIRTELAEELLQRTVEDVDSIRKLIRIAPATLTLFYAPAWKWEIFRTLAQHRDSRDAVREVMQNPEMRKKGKAAAEAAKQIANLIHRLPPDLVTRLLERGIDEQQIYSEAVPFLEKDLGVRVRIVSAEESDHPKALSALPFKPALLME
ncbi:MAG: leucine--tRNA ligase [Methanomicrobiales archaeon]|nr:leucine--tRNA ligase [Methanomicrobiales archaeon]